MAIEMRASPTPGISFLRPCLHMCGLTGILQDVTSLKKRQNGSFDSLDMWEQSQIPTIHSFNS